MAASFASAPELVDIEKIEADGKGRNESMRSYCELSWYTFKSSDDKEKI